MADSRRRALITGITGQDGSFLAELLLAKGYAVNGLARGGEDRHLGHCEHLRGRVPVLDGDLLDTDALRAGLEWARPDELYHLASPSFVPDSWQRPRQTIAAIAGSTAALLEAVRDEFHSTRVFVAGSAAMFGDTTQTPQNELTPCAPDSPYAIAKLASHRIVAAMREHDGIWACSGIMFNHESERAHPELAMRAIARAAVQVKLGRADEVTLASPAAVRDWSFAGDVVRGAWLMLQQDAPDDYVLASGVGRSVAELARVVLSEAGLDADRHIRVGHASQPLCCESAAQPLGREPVASPRPAHATPVVGDPSKARTQLGWQPEVGFRQLVRRMLDAELSALGQPTRDADAGARKFVSFRP